MANGDGGMVWKLFKILFGDVPAQWVRLIIFGMAITLCFTLLRDFRNEIKAEAASVRKTLNEYIAANEAWQDLSNEERSKLLKKANSRFRRLYEHNGWVYEEIEP